MRKMFLILLMATLTRIVSFSSNISEVTNNDTIVSVSITDIKYANLIFVEHKKLLTENQLLKEQTQDYNNLVNNMNKVDSLRKQQNYIHERQIDYLSKECKSKEKAIKYWKVGGITVSIALIIALLVK